MTSSPPPKFCVCDRLSSSWDPHRPRRVAREDSSGTGTGTGNWYSGTQVLTFSSPNRTGLKLDSKIV